MWTGRNGIICDNNISPLLCGVTRTTLWMSSSYSFSKRSLGNLFLGRLAGLFYCDWSSSFFCFFHCFPSSFLLFVDRNVDRVLFHTSRTQSTTIINWVRWAPSSTWCSLHIWTSWKVMAPVLVFSSRPVMLRGTISKTPRGDAVPQASYSQGIPHIALISSWLQANPALLLMLVYLSWFRWF